MNDGIKENHEHESDCPFCGQMERIEEEVNRGEYQFDQEFRDLLKGVMNPVRHTWQGPCQYTKMREKLPNLSNTGPVDMDEVEEMHYDIDFTLTGHTCYIDVNISPPVTIDEEVTIEI